MVGAMLGQADLRLENGELIVQFAAGMEAFKRQVEDRDSLTLLREHAERLTGGPVKVRVELGQADVTPEPTTAATPEPKTAAPAPEPVTAQATDPPPAPAAPERPRAGGGDGLLEQAREEPGVQKLMDAFGAHVVNVRRHDDDPVKTKRAGGQTRPPEDAP